MDTYFQTNRSQLAWVGLLRVEGLVCLVIVVEWCWMVWYGWYDWMASVEFGDTLETHKLICPSRNSSKVQSWNINFSMSILRARCVNMHKSQKLQQEWHYGPVDIGHHGMFHLAGALPFEAKWASKHRSLVAAADSAHGQRSSTSELPVETSWSVDIFSSRHLFMVHVGWHRFSTFFPVGFPRCSMIFPWVFPGSPWFLHGFSVVSKVLHGFFPMGFPWASPGKLRVCKDHRAQDAAKQILEELQAVKTRLEELEVVVPDVQLALKIGDFTWFYHPKYSFFTISEGMFFLSDSMW